MPENGDNAVVAAAVIVRNGKVLLIKRSLPEGHLIWQFPAGKIDAGETPEVAVVREVHEETGLVVRACSRLGERIHPHTNHHMIYVACDIEAGTAHRASRREIAGVAWVAHKDLAGFVPHGFFAPVQKYLDDLLS